MPNRDRMLQSGQRGFFSGLSTTWLLLKVMVPTMVIVQVLKQTGILDMVSRSAAPVMSLFGLPGEASLALITGALVNIYASIAVAVNIPMTAKSMTVLAMMVLIAHNLIVETAVQKKAGTPALIMLASRITASVLAGLLFNWIIPAGSTSLQVVNNNLQSALSTTTMWNIVLTNLVSLIKIALIIMVLMLTTEIMREFGLMDRLMKVLESPMKILGMERKTSFVAVVGLLLGLAYGAGLIIKEAKERSFTSKDILATNIFLGTNHALIEDSLVFAAVGASLPWIVVGRLVFGSIFLRLALPVTSRWISEDIPNDEDQTYTFSA